MEFTIVSACPTCGYPIYGYDKLEENDMPYEKIVEERLKMTSGVMSSCDCRLRMGLTEPIRMPDA